MKESQLVNYVLRRCWYERSWLTVDRANSGARSFTDKSGNKGYIKGHKAGTPDIIGYFAPLGRWLGLECKIGKNKQQDSQIAFEADVKAKGGLYFIVRDMQELENIIQQLKPGAA